MDPSIAPTLSSPTLMDVNTPTMSQNVNDGVGVEDDGSIQETITGLDVGVQYLLVGGLLVVLILLICGVTVCCLAYMRTRKVNNGNVEMQRMDTSSPPVSPTSMETNKSFPESFAGGSNAG